MKTFWYVPIENINSRYTQQLCETWMPSAFRHGNLALDNAWEFVSILPPDVPRSIEIGSVLDGVNRGTVSLTQTKHLLKEQVQTGDIVFFQDFWTPGIEALLYSWHHQGVKPRMYAMVHAQSVDEYDFTYPMRQWMRHIELGWSIMFDGLFVASTVHRNQLKAAGFKCPIHVVGLPIDAAAVSDQMPTLEKRDQVIFTSRLNNEKNPYFMLEVAQRFLQDYRPYEWVVTTSADAFTSEVPGFLEAMTAFAEQEPRFKLLAGLSKTRYYYQLAISRVQFNCSLQDYVSWTLLEASIASCELTYPNFRSFPECVDQSRLYHPFSRDSAVTTLKRACAAGEQWGGTPQACSNGRLIEMAIMLQDWRGPEVNIWHQPESYFRGAGLL